MERMEDEDARIRFDLQLLEPLTWQSGQNSDKALREAEMSLFYAAKNNQ